MLSQYAYKIFLGRAAVQYEQMKKARCIAAAGLGGGGLAVVQRAIGL
jgi:hypothetical protein